MLSLKLGGPSRRPLVSCRLTFGVQSHNESSFRHCNGRERLMRISYRSDPLPALASGTARERFACGEGGCIATFPAGITAANQDCFPFLISAQWSFYTFRQQGQSCLCVVGWLPEDADLAARLQVGPFNISQVFDPSTSQRFEQLLPGNALPSHHPKVHDAISHEAYRVC